MYGKITKVVKQDTTITYTYDAAGNRVSKTIAKPGSDTLATWYVRDASGNVMSIYAHGDASTNSGQLTQAEVPMYGSSRLGMIKPNINVHNTAAPDTISLAGLGFGYTFSYFRGRKFFELTNHLGNVLAVISDKKTPIDDGVYNDNGAQTSTTPDGSCDYFAADVVSAQDYYPGGSIEPGRSFSAGMQYRYGFNGKEKSDEIDGSGVDYGARIYDARIARFLSVDPLEGKFPWNSVYSYAEGDIIRSVDLDGEEKFPVTGDYGDPKNLPNSLKVQNVINVANQNAQNRAGMAEQKAIAEQNAKRLKNVVINRQLKCHPDGQLIAELDNYRIAVAYSKLDHAHGQVDFPRSLVWDLLLGQRSHNGFIVDENGYQTNRLAPRELSFDAPVGDEPLAGFGAFKEFESASALLKSESAATDLTSLQAKLEALAQEHLLPKYLKVDPELEAGYTGSFKTGKVGNPLRPTFGQPIDLKAFDVDYWIKSDILFAKYGKTLRADAEFRQILSETPGFEGLKAGRKGFSIKFKPSK